MTWFMKEVAKYNATILTFSYLGKGIFLVCALNDDATEVNYGQARRVSPIHKNIQGN